MNDIFNASELPFNSVLTLLYNRYRLRLFLYCADVLRFVGMRKNVHLSLWKLKEKKIIRVIAF